MAEDFMHYGEDFAPPDQVAKVTGRAKFADDVLYDDLLHAKTLKSPYAHAIVTDIDTSAAEEMAGVESVITFEDVGGEKENLGFHPLDEEPKYYGAPIAAVAAEDEHTAAEAVEAIDVSYDVLDHVVDPVETLKPGSPNARHDGNTQVDGEVTEVKWDTDFSGDFPDTDGIDDWSYQWEYGDLEAGFDAADHIIEDVQQAHAVPQNPMEPRANVANWDNGNLTLHASSQSGTFNVPAFLGEHELTPAELNIISEYCGGGFGSKAAAYPQQHIPIYLSRETNRPVKIRGSRKEEFFWGNGRTPILFKFRVGVTDDGEITAWDQEMIATAGAVDTSYMAAFGGATETISAAADIDAMRVKGMGVFTNHPKTWPHRGPGENQFWLAAGYTLGKVADEIGMDQLEFEKGISADHHDTFGPNQVPNTSCYREEALEQAAEMIDYDEIVDLNGEVVDGKLYGVGVCGSEHPAGSVGLDGMVVIRPDGTVEVRTGIGNLGTYSYAAAARSAAETLKVDWDQVEVKWGQTEREPDSIIQAGSNTVFTETFTQKRAAETAIQYLQEIAAEELGGEPDDYEVEGGEVFHTDDPGQSLGFGEAAEIALDLGGEYTGEAILEDEDAPYGMSTMNAVGNSIGEGLIALGHTTQEDLDGHSVRSYCSCIALVSIDLDTGNVTVEDFTGVSDCGTVIHPTSVKGQVEGGIIQGIGYALTEHYAFDEDTGIPYNTDWYTNKTPTILDYGTGEGGGVDEPDFFGAHGGKGLGEPPYGAGAGAVTNAVYNALGTDIEPPVFSSKVLDALENGETEVM